MESYTSEVFGNFLGQEINKITLTNKLGLQLSVLNLGAIIQSIQLPKGFKSRQMVLGFDNLNGYISKEYRENYPYFGAVIGRHAGRISHGKTSILGEPLTLDTNNGKHHLHGGYTGFDSKVWNIDKVTNQSVTFSLLSKDGDQNYPGNLQVEVTYTLLENNSIKITYKANTDKPTLVNLTQHTYFNLDQDVPNVLEDQIWVNANEYLEMSDEVVPTGHILDTKNSPFNFETFKNIPSQIDHPFIINKNNKPAAILRNKQNSVRMEVETTQPIVHIYSGYYVPNLQAESRMNLGPNAGVCFETQGYLDTENHKEFPSNVLLPDKEYMHETIFKFLFKQDERIYNQSV